MAVTPFLFNADMTKKEIKERLSKILSEPEHSITGQEYEFVLSVLQKHHDWDEKSKGQQCRIVTRRAMYGTKCFWLLREDGTSTDISYIQALAGKPTPRQDVIRACRTAVQPVISAFRAKVREGVDRCPFTDEILFAGNIHIDHYNLKFSELVNFWIDHYSVEYLASYVNESKDGDMTCYFTDERLISEFVRYHNANTNLRAVSVYANLKILK